jgi:prepilin-type processing-associated H-X9-DG protein
MSLDTMNFKAAEIFIAGEGNSGIGGTDARYSKARLPDAWRTQEGSPARRHFDTGSYLYADGHVKSLKPEHVTDKQFKIQPPAVTSK